MKSKKALEDLMNILLWIIFLIIAIGGLYFLINFLTK